MKIRSRRDLAAFILLAGILACGMAPGGRGATPAAHVIEAGPDWAPYDPKRGIAMGGAFDFSSWADAPAGKYGRLVATPQGHFEFAMRPGVRRRFWGADLCLVDSAFPTHVQSDAVASDLVRCGYNTIRLHLFDAGLQDDKPFSTVNGLSSRLDPGQLDRIEYLFAALKEAGLYLNIDLYSFRSFRKEEIPDLDKDLRLDVKELFPVSEAAFAAWTAFAKNLLTHRNPYTGMTWAADPALIGICPVNENPLRSWVIHRTPRLQAIYDRLFTAWKTAHPELTAKGETDATLFNRFLTELEMKCDGRMRDVLGDLHVQALITGSNCLNAEAQAYPRSRYDYVDDHDYWDHPRWLDGNDWRLPGLIDQTSAVTADCRLPRAMMPSRLFGKPFAVTEYQYCWPNHYRAEGGILMGAYSGLQDWDAVYTYSYANVFGDVVAPAPIAFFAMTRDPIAQFAGRIGAMLFRRGEITPAPHAICLAVTDASAYGNGARPHDYPGSPLGASDDFSRLGLVTRIGSCAGSPGKIAASSAARETGIGAIAVEGGAPDGQGVFRVDADLGGRLGRAGLIPAASVPACGRSVSETGQIRADRNGGTVQVVTDRSEGFVLPAGASLSGNRVVVRNGAVFGIVFVSALDGRPLGSSRHLVVFHLTDAMNSGTTFADATDTTLTAYGTLPVLIRKGNADIGLTLAPGEWNAWVIDAAGIRQRRASFRRSGEKWMLNAQTVTSDGVSLAYELEQALP